MRAYRNLLKELAESRPRRLAALPREFLVRQAQWLLDQGDIYVLEQVEKHVAVLDEFPAEHLARAAERALARGAVDDYCFLHGRLAPEHRPTAARVNAAYALLARRGNAAGIEQLAAATGIDPVIDKETALRAYDVLIAAGRLGAVDYIRQLSKVPVRFDAEAVAAGVRTLLISGRYAALRSLARTVPGPVPWDPDHVRGAVRRALDDGTSHELAEALVSLGCTGILDGFPEQLGRLVAEDRLGDVPALFVLFRDADQALIDDALWERLLTCDSTAAVRFAWERCDDTEQLARHAPAAYRRGVENADRALVRLCCARGNVPLVTADALALLGAALEAGDKDWVDFATGRLGPLQGVDPDCAQLFLARLARHDPGQVAAAAERLGVTADPYTGQWLLDLADGRFDAAEASAGRAGGHDVASVAFGPDRERTGDGSAAGPRSGAAS